MQFWLDTILQWERDKQRVVFIGLSATKDVTDAVLADPKYATRISTIDLRGWWYLPDGTLDAPRGGRQVAGRYRFGVEKTTPEQFYRQIREYRENWPHKALVHNIPGTRQHAWAALMAGGSMLIGQMPYPGLEDPAHYIAPERCRAIQSTYDFIRGHLADSLPAMKPSAVVKGSGKRTWCLASPGHTYLVYALAGGRIQLDLADAKRALHAQWFDPRGGKLSDAGSTSVAPRHTTIFQAPDDRDWVLWLKDTPGG